MNIFILSNVRYSLEMKKYKMPKWASMPRMRIPRSLKTVLDFEMMVKKKINTKKAPIICPTMNGDIVAAIKNVNIFLARCCC